MCLGVTTATSTAAERGVSRSSKPKQRASSSESHSKKASKKRSSKASHARSHTSHRSSKASSRTRDRARSSKNRDPDRKAESGIQPDANILVELPTHEFESENASEVDDDQSYILLGESAENDENTVANAASPPNDWEN